MTTPRCACLLIAGVGLLGGSLAAAVRRRNLARRIIGYGRNAARLQAAKTRGLLDHYVTSPSELPADVEFAVVCTPVTRIVEDVRQLRPHLPPRAIVTDVGSTKGTICRALAQAGPAGPWFVGSHPIAGSEKQGFEHADAELFVGRTCVVTPDSHPPDEVVERVVTWWRDVGMVVERLSPVEHDRALARTSHVPHLVAAGLAASLDPRDLRWAGTGFRDTTRIAAGDPELWTAILRENREQVRVGLAEVVAKLRQFDAALATDDAAAMMRLLAEGQTLRNQLPGTPSTAEE